MKVRYHYIAGVILICLYIAIIIPFTNYMHSKPYVEKLGLIPSAKALKFITADQKELAAASIISKAYMYYGGIMDPESNKLNVPPDYAAISRTLFAALQLDPYNTDGYYFAQSFLTWDVHQYQVANNFLEHGMKYRTWDTQLPFFAGFNYAYFLKDYKKAAEMYQIAATRSGGSKLYSDLAGRYMQDGGETEMAILYLKSLEKGSRGALQESYQKRISAFEMVSLIEQARDRFKADHHKLPDSVETLFTSGYLKEIPKDPYGGTFYIDTDGKVKTTSKFADFDAKKSEKAEATGGNKN